MATATARLQRGEIEASTAYPLETFIRKTGLGRKAIARLRRDGMPVRVAGRQRFIIGADFIEALAINPRNK
jgi:hypothetical protein